MIYNGIKLHNIVEVEQLSRMPGVRLHRFPGKVRNSVSEKGRSKAVETNGGELRFVTDSRFVRVTLSSYERNGKVMVFKGDFFHSVHTIPAGGIHTLTLETPERFTEVNPAALDNGAFSSRVWRIYFDRFSAVFHHIDAFGHEVKAPNQEDLPPLTFLAYGSSITHSAGATNHYNGYVQQAARRLEIDVLNLGMSGTCLCEREMADHIAERSDWDIAFFELGVNMRSEFTVEQFAERSSYLLDRVIALYPDKPIFLTGIYPNRVTYFANSGQLVCTREKEYNDVLRRYVEEKRHERLHFIEGHEIMTDFRSLTSDLIHPSDYGHMLMGEKLAAMMRDTVETMREKTGDRIHK